MAAVRCALYSSAWSVNPQFALMIWLAGSLCDTKFWLRRGAQLQIENRWRRPLCSSAQHIDTDARGGGARPVPRGVT